MPNINFLIKPASSRCNMNCKYCFYHDVSDNRLVKDYGLINSETIENIVKKGLEYANGAFVTFAFQGGEPTLVGLAFYEKFTDFVKKYNVKNSKVQYAIQTNGLLINDEWSKFFKVNKFLIGLSIDGTKDIHDLNRINYQNEGTFKKVLNASKLFDKYQVDYNILTVVTRQVTRKIRSIYQFYKKQGFRYLQFIPCLDPLNDKKSEFKYSLTPKDYEKFLKDLFDIWYKDMMNNDSVSIRFFDNVLGMFLGYQPESCDMVGRCSVQHVIESDGSVYPCDFYVLDEMKIGDINIDSIESMFKHKNSTKFVNESFNVHPKCKVCEYYTLCRGGCKRHKEKDITDELGLNYFCSAYKGFYEHTVERFREITLKYRSKM